MRVENWPRLLTEYLESCKDKPFVWGSHDCCTFASDWVLIATGTDPMADLRGSYKTQKGAVKLLKKSSIVDRFSEVFVETGRYFAQRGDIGCVETEYGETMGIVNCGLWCVAEDGLRVVPLDSCKKFWRVG